MAGEKHIDNLLSIGLKIDTHHKNIFKDIQDKVKSGDITSEKVIQTDFCKSVYKRGHWVEVGEAKHFKSIWEASNEFELRLVIACAKKVIFTLPSKSHSHGRIFLPLILWEIKNHCYCNRDSISTFKIREKEIKILKEFFDIGKMMIFLTNLEEGKKW